jgi:hypothetical protein
MTHDAPTSPSTTAPTPAADAAAPIRVASVPAGHPYVRSLLDPLDPSGRVVHLADPLPDPAEPARWWPPVVLDAAWLRAHAHEVDLLHVHFGTESYPTEHLVAVVETLRDLRLPLVYTVHDLTNPQLVDQAPHVEHLDVLIPAADELITLTDAAADEVEARWGRRPTVIAHPAIADPDAELPVGTPGDTVVVGVHLRDLRPNVAGVETVRTLLAAVEALSATGAAVEARVDLNERVRDPEQAARIRELVRAAGPSATLAEHPRLTDADLERSLADLDVSVLPYRHGTHSGWVELCWDLAVPVAAPRVGHAAGQHLEPGSTASFDLDDPASLAAAVIALVSPHAVDETADAHDDPARVPASRRGTPHRAALQQQRRTVRRRQRHDVAAAHLAVYERALATVAAVTA